VICHDRSWHISEVPRCPRDVLIEGISEVKYSLRLFRLLIRTVIAPVSNPNARSKIEDRDNDPIASETH
jgi:hypothetical protein